MGLVSAKRFKQLLLRLGPDDFVRFVAALWSARGMTTTTQGATIFCSPENRSQIVRITVWYRRIIPWVGIPIPLSTVPDREVLAETDILVTNVESEHLRIVTDATDTDYVGPEKLRQLILYAIDRDASQELFQQYFNRPVDTNAEAETKDGRFWTPIKDPTWGERVGDRLISDQRISLSVKCSVIVGLIIAMVILTTFSLTAPSNGSGTLKRSTARSRSDDTSIETDRLKERYPPGISATGLENITALRRAHIEALEKRTYHLVIRHEGTRGTFVTSRRWLHSRQRIRKITSGYYHYSVNGRLVPASIATSPRRIQFALEIREPECAVLTSRMKISARGGRPCSLVESDGVSSVGRVTSQYLDRYLEGNESAVRIHRRGNQTWYRVIVTRAPEEVVVPTRNYTAVALVTRSGFVRELSVKYETPVATRSAVVSFSFRFSDATGRPKSSRYSTSHGYTLPKSMPGSISCCSRPHRGRN